MVGLLLALGPARYLRPFSPQALGTRGAGVVPPRGPAGRLRTAGGHVPDHFDSFRVLAPDAALAERAAAEAWAAGACGVEERGDGLELVVYAPSGCTDAVHRAVGALAGAGVEVAASEPVPPVDWSRAWRDGLRAIEISPRLVVRPSTVDAPDGVHEASVVIDPGQAFGTGGTPPPGWR